MKHNGFYSDVEELLADPEFRSDFDTQEQELKKLRKKIKTGETPGWIIDALEDMHATYPEGQSLRYRSSTNNEDLPGFSGAGLYDSKTQDPEETTEDGIDKSVKGVWASLWNFRAFIERDTHGVDHLATAMGVLVHPNYSGELANGVAVSFDPIRSTEGSYYVNTQLGEDLVTNPDAHSVPEEILLNSAGSYTTLAASNQVAHGQLLMSDSQIEQLRQHLQVIHDHFEGLYNPDPDEPFAMEIEFKITSDDILAIKQARPWVFSVPNSAATGAPTISGTAQLGETLTADTSAIADEDGLTNATFIYQWSRNHGNHGNNGNDGADIEGATEPTYTPSVSDVGKTIRVRASFTDDANNAETLTSAATGVVQPGSNAWSATMTVETRDGYTGYSYWGDPDMGSLSETTVEWDGKTHYVRYLFLKDGELWLGLNQEMLSTGFALLVGDGEFGSADAMVDKGGASYRFRWDDPGLGWSDGAEVTVNLVQSDQNTPALGAPTISGTAQVDGTLTADTTGVEDADGLTNVSYSYQWMRSDNGTDNGIEDATDATYTPSVSDVGKTIRVKVTFTDDAENTETLTSEATLAVAATVPAAPQSFTLATGDQDQQLVASWQAPSSNGGSDVTGYRVQWKESTGSWDTEADVSEATASGTTHTITGLTGGVEYAVRVIATNSAGDGPASTQASATPIGEVSAENSAPTGLPTISGTPQVDQPLTADTSAIDDEDGLINVSWEYQWIAGGSDISGATGSTYTLTASEQGKTIQVKVTFTDDADNTDTLTSEATVAVAPSPSPSPLKAAFQDLPDSHDGSTAFTFRVLFSEDVGISYVNMRDDAFSLSEGDVTGARRVDGRNDLWEVTVEPDDNSDVGITLPANRSCATTGAICTREDSPRQLTNSHTATVTGPAEAPPTNTPAAGALTISGTPQVEQTLTADTSLITDQDGLTNVSYEYQWIAGGSDIAGATGSTYDLTSSEEGKTIQVRVTFTDDRGNNESLTSEATVEVAAKPNTSPTGLPTMGGTPQVEETLTADTSPIDDQDGLNNVSWEYQWLAAGTAIDGATASSYQLTSSEQGKTIQVRVTFTDDRGNSESLTSEATIEVAAKPVPLTASFSNVPNSHSGSGTTFTFDLAFSEDFPLSYITLRDHAFNEDDDGPVTIAQRKVQGSNQTWTITVEPQGNGAITVTLPATTDCNDSGAICTGDGRKLSNSLSFTVSGPGG